VASSPRALPVYEEPPAKPAGSFLSYNLLKIKYIIIDLVNFTKTADELVTIEDKWLVQ